MLLVCTVMGIAPELIVYTIPISLGWPDIADEAGGSLERHIFTTD